MPSSPRGDSPDGCTPAAGAALSVVLVATTGTSSIARTMRHLRLQSARRAMEVVVVAPTAESVDVGAIGGDEFAALRVVAAGPITERGAAAALGIAASTAPVVGLIEDHSFPEPGWAAALIRAHAGDWTGVGPAVENANPASVVSWVNFILTYGDFCGPVTAGERPILPWHNTAYKREALAPFADRLGALLDWEGALQEALRAGGHRLYLEPAARTHHSNVSRWGSALALNFQRGRILGARRADREGWPRWMRLLRAGAFPAYPLLQFFHVAPGIRRVGMPPSLLPRVLPALAIVLVAMAIGEASGYALGIGDAIAKMEDYELHRSRHLSRRDALAADALAAPDRPPAAARAPA